MGTERLGAERLGTERLGTERLHTVRVGQKIGSIKTTHRGTKRSKRVRKEGRSPALGDLRPAVSLTQKRGSLVGIGSNKLLPREKNSCILFLKLKLI